MWLKMGLFTSSVCRNKEDKNNGGAGALDQSFRSNSNDAFEQIVQRSPHSNNATANNGLILSMTSMLRTAFIRGFFPPEEKVTLERTESL